MSKKYLVIFYLGLISNIVTAQLSGGGDLNPDLKAPVESQEMWMDLRVGLSVHWGPSSLGGKEISWSRDRQISKEVYDNYYKEFAPVKFDANEWAQLMKRWGIKYMAPTAKHHDGFCLWYSDYSDYDMSNAAFKVDIMEELAKACKQHNIMLGAYYSNLDWYHPDWAPYQYGGPGPLFEKKEDSPNLERYFKFFEEQCVELITKYDLDFMQFDGEWDSTYTHEVGSMLYRRFHEVKPDILLNSRIDIGRRSVDRHNHLYMDGLKYCGDFQDRERVVNYGNNVIGWLDHPWQAWVTIDKSQWSYNPKPKLMNSDELIRDMVSVVGNNGNYMINLGPRPDGSFEPEQIALMDELGLWLKEHGEAIYGTRGGPFYPYKQGVSTRKGNKAWLMITDPKASIIYLPKLPQEIVSAKVYNTNADVPFSTEDDLMVFSLNDINNSGPVRIIELKFKEKVQMASTKKVVSDYEIQGASKLTEGLKYELSSRDNKLTDESQEGLLFSDKAVNDYAFITNKEACPFIKIDLGAITNVHGVKIYNRKLQAHHNAKNLTVWISVDGQKWDKYWSTKSIQENWDIPFVTKSMGATISGKKLRYLKIGIGNKKPTVLHLNQIEIFGR